MKGKNIRILPLYFLILYSCGTAAQEISISAEAARTELLFDNDWKFHRGGAEGAYDSKFNDSEWRVLDLPHDWSIEDIPGTNSPFDPNAVGQTGAGFTKGGTSWYRKTLFVVRTERDLKALLQFDGVYMNCEVWLNGKKLGEHPYGYTSFWFNISDALKYGEENVIAVKVKNEGENSRWYSGSGIYRHVWLKFMDPVHVGQWGTKITTPNVTTDSAGVQITNFVQNETAANIEVSVETVILDWEGKEVAKNVIAKLIGKGGSETVLQEIPVNFPKLWSVKDPYLYTARTSIFANGVLRDQLETTFGIRSIKFDPEAGFQLNGETVKLKGGNVHHDNGPLGAKAYDRAEERRVELLKASGYNAIRSAHNPPSPAFLEACDRLGMLVINEAFDMWDRGKNPNDYHLYFQKYWQKDVAGMVNRDFNHPSIIMWSIGNEIPNMEDRETVNTAMKLAGFIRQLDPFRPVTAAINGLGPAKDPFFQTLDIAGYNYAVSGDHGKQDIYTEDHKRRPKRIIYGAESYPLVAYDSWKAAEEKPWVIGDFVWASFDYIGEASIGWLGYPTSREFFPWTLAYCGDLDICGWKRPQSYYRDAFWGEEPAISIFVKSPEPSFEERDDRASWSKWHYPDLIANWNWSGYEGKDLEVVVYSSYDEVDLVLNGRSLGTKKTDDRAKNMATWIIPYQSGKLEAVGYKEQRPGKTVSLNTTKKPARLQLSADRNEIKDNGQDLSYITVEVQDVNGNLNPDAENLITFEIEGPGTIVAVGNANPVSTESFTGSSRKAWRGKCLVIIKSEENTGSIRLTSKSEGFPAESITIRSMQIK